MQHYEAHQGDEGDIQLTSGLATAIALSIERTRENLELGIVESPDQSVSYLSLRAEDDPHTKTLFCSKLHSGRAYVRWGEHRKNLPPPRRMTQYNIENYL